MWNERGMLSMIEGRTLATRRMIWKTGSLGLGLATALLLFVGLWMLLGRARPAAADGPWYVDAATGDDGNDCLTPSTACATVGATVDKAVSGDTIYIAAGVYPTNISYSGKDVTYIGAGPEQTILDGGGVDQVLRATIANTEIFSLTIRNGYSSGNMGAGVQSDGSLIMSDVVLRDNIADDENGGGLWAGGNITLTNVLATNNAGNHGSGFYLNFWFEEDDVALENVAVVANNTTGSGGALMLRGVNARITNTTVSDNTGIGIYASNFAEITMTHSTVADNEGLGLYYPNNNGWTQNSVIAGNNDGGAQCSLTSIWVTSWGGNVEDGDSCAFDHATDQVNVDPLLEPLGDYGGDTLIRALTPGSPAVDAATDTGCTATDQRGVARPQEGDGTPPAACDSGAFEYAEIGLSEVSIDGPGTANVATNVTLEAAISPDTATQPVTYTWTADGQTPVTHSSGVTDSVTFSWDSTGTKTIQVTADNGLGQSNDSVQITIQEGEQSVSSVSIDGPTAGNAGQTYTFTAQTEPADATLPVTYTWQIDGQAPATHVGGLNHTLALSWPDVGTYALTVTATNAAGSVNDSHTIVITAWYVDAADGDDGNDCQTPATACRTIQTTLGRAPAGAVIQIAPGTYSETVQITQTADLIGAGAGQTVLTTGAGPVVTVDDGELTTFVARLEGVTIEGGPEEGIRNEEELAVSGSVIANNGSYGILNYGSVTVSESAIQGNRAPGGAALMSTGLAELNAVSIYGNVSENSIVHTQGSGETSLTNVTVSNNETGDGTGAAVTGASNATVAILNSTIVHNSGGGVADYGTQMTLQNTVLADHGGDNCWTSVTSLGHNVEDGNTCELDGAGDQSNTDPRLGLLADNGGPTLTHLPETGSPLIDTGDNGACPATDQRGEARPYDGNEDGTAVCDVGAVEVTLAVDVYIFLPAVMR